MKPKRLLSLALSLIISAGALSFANITNAISDTDEVLSEGTYGLMTYEIRLDENGEKYASITDCDDTISGDVTIPSMLEGVPVKEIDNGAFNYCEAIDSVVFPDTLEYIRWGAFYQAHYLGAVHIPSSVRIIEPNAFYACYITEITIDYGLESLSGLDYNSFTEIELPASVSYVSDAFYSCGYLEKLVVYNPDCEFVMHDLSLYDHVVIYGYDGSTAQALANELGNEFVSLGEVSIGDSITRPFPEIALGDVNSDDTVDPVDATLVLQHYSLSSMESDSGLSDTQLIAADVNNDDAVDPVDATWILRYYSYTSMNGEDTIEDFIKNN